MLKFISLRLRMPFYAVANGRKAGIFSSWSECEQQVKGFSGAVYKKFKSKDEAENFIKLKGNQPRGSRINFSTSRHDIKHKQENSKESKEQQEIEKVLLEALEQEDMLELSGSEPAKKRQKLDYTENDDINDVLKCLNEEEKDWIPDKIKAELPSLQTQSKKYGSYFFNEDSQGFVQVFTDGSCENNGRKNAIAGLGVYFGENHPLNASEPVTGRATNNIGEIQASIKAIKLAQKSGVLRLNIFTDSQFLINSVCKWMTNWKSNNWMLSTGKPVANQKDFKVLDKLINSGNMLIKWSYIPAHRGHHGNEMADRLAKEGARKQV